MVSACAPRLEVWYCMRREFGKILAGWTGLFLWGRPIPAPLFGGAGGVRRRRLARRTYLGTKLRGMGLVVHALHELAPAPWRAPLTLSISSGCGVHF